MTVKEKANAWLQLVRLPNLFTVPGEAIVGGLLAGISVKSTAIAGLAFLLIYMGGLILNDVVDYDEDRRERAWRPLPAETIARSEAIVMALLCYFFGSLSAFLVDGPRMFFALTMVIVALTLLYNLAARKIPPLGWTTIALCRSLIPISLFLMSDRASVTPLVYATGIQFYIWIISAAAHGETKGAPSFPVHVFLPLVVLTCLAVLHVFSVASVLSFLWALPAVFILFIFSVRLRKARKPAVVQMYVGKCIGAVLFFQGAALLVSGSLTGLGLWLIYPFSSLAAKRFKGS